MRLYETACRDVFTGPKADLVPGFRLTQVIDQFYAEGVVPDFLPADLGEDGADELDADGNFAVDPAGRIDIDRMDRLEAQLTAGLDAIDSSTIPVTPVVPKLENNPSPALPVDSPETK